MLAVVGLAAVILTGTIYRVRYLGEILTLNVAMILAGLGIAWWYPGRTRAFWIGFATACASGLLLVSSPLGDGLPTTHWFKALSADGHRPAVVGGVSRLVPDRYDPLHDPGGFESRQDQSRRTLRSLNCLLSLVLGAMVGLLAWILRGRVRSEVADSDPPEGRLLATGFSRWEEQDNPRGARWSGGWSDL
jgi:hypothetical protein